MSSRGFTLLEVLVALIILSVGLLAFAAAAASTTRLISDGRRLERAALAAWSELERLREGGCPEPGSGGGTQGVFDVTWAVWVGSGGASRRLQVVVRTRGEAVGGGHTLSTVVAC
jgi:prepilin-type N-terminal cleavage/methylation domain-containing protein